MSTAAVPSPEMLPHFVGVDGVITASCAQPLPHQSVNAAGVE